MSPYTTENKPIARHSVLTKAKEIAETLRERQLLRESGLMNTIIPTALGGLGEDWKTMLQIARVFSKVDSSIGHLFGFQHLILSQDRSFWHRKAEKPLL